MMQGQSHVRFHMAFRMNHLSQLQVQPAQRWTLEYLTPHLDRLRVDVSQYGVSQRQPILCGGVIEQRPDYGILWSFVGQVGPHDFFHYTDLLDYLYGPSLTDGWKCTSTVSSSMGTDGPGTGFDARLRVCAHFYSTDSTPLCTRG